MTFSYIITILFLAMVAGGATFLGVFIGCRSYQKKRAAFGLSFAGAIMILISIFELVPSAYKESNFMTVALSFLAGAILIYIANLFIPHIHSIKEIENCPNKNLVRISYLLAIGMILHDFPEGFAIPSSFGYSAGLGFLVVIASFIHNIPEGYVLSCTSNQYQKNNFYYRSALFSTLSTFFGAVLGLILLNQFHFLNPVLLAVAAGVMFYISLHELIPYAQKNKRGLDTIFGFISAGIIFLILQIIF